MCLKFFNNFYQFATFERDEGLVNAKKIFGDISSERRGATIQELEEIFLGLDSDCSGTLDKAEVDILVTELMKKFEVEQNAVSQLTTILFQLADDNDDGCIDFMEFMAHGEEILNVLIKHINREEENQNH